MRFSLFFIAVLWCPLISAFVHPSFNRAGRLDFEAALEFEVLGLKNFKGPALIREDTNIKNLILKDHDKRIDARFTIPKYFRANVNFWFDIYTKYNSSTIVLHDINNLALVYSILDFSDLFKSDIHRFSKANLLQVLSREKIKNLKKTLKKIGGRRFSKMTLLERELYLKVKTAYGRIPKSKREKRKFFHQLAKGIRTQTGQRSHIYNGIVRFKKLEPFLLAQVKNFNLPKEILAIAFLESSFNVEAKSKVDASGIWQFMPFIGDLFMPKRTSDIDYRESPVVSSLAAFHLLKQNFKILKRWDLAVTAYNSGTKHLLRARAKFPKVEKFTLPFVFQNYKTDHLGFASVNFYAEFLALVHVLAYKETLFNTDGLNITPLENIKIYLAKCRFGPKSMGKNLSGLDPILNHHIVRRNKIYSRGIIFSNPNNLSKRYYYLLKNKELTKKFPKNYIQYISKEKCGRL